MLADGVEYRLPRRDLGPIRFVGALIFLVGLIFAGAAGAMSIAAFRVLVFRSPMQGSPPTWPMLVFLLVFLFIGLLICSAGLGFFTGRSVVRICGSTITASHTLGAFRRRYRADLTTLSSLSVVRGQTSRNGQVITKGVLANLSMLVAQSEDADKPIFLAIGYPAEMLRSLSDSIGADRGIKTQLVRGLSRRRHLPSADRLAQPMGSHIVVTRTPDQLTLTIPARGILKGSSGLFTFSLLWFAFCALFTVGIGVGIGKGTSGSGGQSLISPFACFISIFWLVGIGTLIYSINMGRRRAFIDVLNGQTVLINLQSLLGLKQHQWTRDEIKRIVAGHSGLTVNNRSVEELQFHVWQSRTGRRRQTKKYGFFAGRESDELDWLSELLNHELGRG